MHSLDITNQELSQVADEAIGLAKTYWASLEGKGLAHPATSGKQTAELFSRRWREEGCGQEVLQDFKLIAEHARPSTGRFFGYVVGSGEPIGALGELLAAVLNQNVTSWRSAPAATSIETTVIGWLAEQSAAPDFKGYLCGGGLAGNLFGLAMAREAKLPANETGLQPCTVYASEQAHMSIPKAIALLGIGRSNLRLLPVDGDLRMRTDALEAAIAADRQSGKTPIANIGAIDPLPEIAQVAKREGVWLHVDGAYGGLAALAVPEKFEGLNEADLVSLAAVTIRKSRWQEAA